MERKSSIAIASSNPFPLHPEQRGINPFRQYIYMLHLFFISFPFGCDFEACGGDEVAVLSIVTKVWAGDEIGLLSGILRQKNHWVSICPSPFVQFKFPYYSLTSHSSECAILLCLHLLSSPT